MSTETAVDPRIAKSNDALRTPMGEFWRKFKKQPVAMAAAGFVFFIQRNVQRLKLQFVDKR